MKSLLPATRESLGADDIAAMYALPPPGQRHLRVNFAAALDGGIEVAGRSDPLSSPADKALFKTLRRLCDAVLVGQSTALMESYGPLNASAAGPARPIAIVARQPRLDPASLLFTEPEEKPILIVPDSADTAAYDDLGQVIRTGPTVDYARALDALAALGCTRVLCEGGPTVFGHLLDAGLVDEICLTVSPLLAGPDAARLTAGPPWSQAPKPLRLLHLLEEDGFLFTRWAAR